MTNTERAELGAKLEEICLRHARQWQITRIENAQKEILEWLDQLEAKIDAALNQIQRQRNIDEINGVFDRLNAALLKGPKV